METSSMTPDDFRHLALALPEALEGEHMRHPDFRVGERIFATTGYPDERWAVLQLNPDLQAELMQRYPARFEPVPGGWGRQGSTRLLLAEADPEAVRAGLELAHSWQRSKPPKRKKS